MISAAVELWLFDRDCATECLAGIESRLQLLPGDEIARADRQRDRVEAQRWLNGRIALRLLLRSRLDVAAARSSFIAAEGGRPVLQSDGLEFSLADSGAMMLIGLSNIGRIGVDLEAPRSINMPERRADRLIAAARGLAGPLDQHDQAGNLRQAWTRIEAFAKAAAPSLASGLAMLGTAGRGGDPATLEDLSAHAARVRAEAGVAVHDLDLPDDFLGALAAPAPDLPAGMPKPHAVNALTERQLMLLAEEA